MTLCHKRLLRISKLQMDYTGEVEHSDQLIIRGAQPFNAEPLASALVEFVYTPEELIYCRNHSML